MNENLVKLGVLAGMLSANMSPDMATALSVDIINGGYDDPKTLVKVLLHVGMSGIEVVAFVRTYKRVLSTLPTMEESNIVISLEPSLN